MIDCLILVCENDFDDDDILRSSDFTLDIDIELTRDIENSNTENKVADFDVINEKNNEREELKSINEIRNLVILRSRR